MWSRKKLKQNAKDIMNNNYFNMLGVSVIATLLNGSLIFSINEYFNQLGKMINVQSDPFTEISANENPQAFFVILISLLIGSFFIIVFRLLFNLLIANPITVGHSKYYIKNRKNQGNFKDLFYAFRHNYINIVVVMLLMYIKIFLWTLLLIIPGIIKSYEYSMIPYILSERPDISYKEAFELSKQLTEDQKINLFNLDLSFIGWDLLGMLVCGFGIIFVYPYYYATHVEAYEKLKEIKQIEISPKIPPIPTL